MQAETASLLREEFAFLLWDADKFYDNVELGFELQVCPKGFSHSMRISMEDRTELFHFIPIRIRIKIGPEICRG